MSRKFLAGVGLVLTMAAALATGPAYATAQQGSPKATNSHAADAHQRSADKKAAKAAKKSGAVLDTGTPGSGGLLGAVPDSYPLTSATYSMGKFGDSPEVLAACASGFFVGYSAGDVRDYPFYYLDVGVSSSSTLVTTAYGYPKAWNQVATDSGGNPQYQGFWMKLSNDNPLDSGSGSFTWTCNPVL